MNIIDDSVSSDLAAGRPLALDLGSGGPGRDGAYGVDFMALPGVAIQADLNCALDELPDNSVGRVITSHCLEHVQNFLPLMRELHRVTRPGGTLRITVPHFSNPFGYSDPTHVRFFGLYTFNYFVPTQRQPARKVPCYYSDVRFEVLSVRIELMPRNLRMRLLHPWWGRRINRSFETQADWELRLCWLLPAAEISYVLAPVK